MEEKRKRNEQRRKKTQKIILFKIYSLYDADCSFIAIFMF